MSAKRKRDNSCRSTSAKTVRVKKITNNGQEGCGESKATLKPFNDQTSINDHATAEQALRALIVDTVRDIPDGASLLQVVEAGLHAVGAAAPSDCDYNSDNGDDSDDGDEGARVQRDAARDRFVALDSLAAAMAVLRVNNGDAAVVRVTCELLKAIASSRDARRQRIADAGGVGAAMAALRAQPGDAAVVKAALRLMRAVLPGDERTSAERRRVPIAADSARSDCIVAAGGIEAVVAALRDHQGDAGVMSAVFALLGDVSFTSANARAERIVAAGGLEAAVAALVARDDTTCATSVAFAFLRVVSSAGSDASKQRAVDAGGVDAAVAAVRANPRDLVFVAKAWDILEALDGDSGDAHKKIADTVIEAAVEDLRGDGDQCDRCDLLDTITQDSDAHKQRFLDTGGAEAVVAALRVEPDDNSLPFSAFSLLDGVVDGSAARAQAVADAGGVAVAHEGIRELNDDPDIVEQAVVFLHSGAKTSAPFRQRIAAVRGMKTRLQAARRAFSHYEHLPTSAQWLLKNCW